MFNLSPIGEEFDQGRSVLRWPSASILTLARILDSRLNIGEMRSNCVFLQVKFVAISIDAVVAAPSASVGEGYIYQGIDAAQIEAKRYLQKCYRCYT